MRVSISVFRLPKAGNREGECEDQFELPKNHKKSRQKFRFAVADGATESAFSGLWAQKLVRAYVNTNPRKRKPATPTELYKIIEEYAPQWSKEVWARPLPWFAQEKAQQGAFSTLLGLYLEDKPQPSCDGYWNALGVGDTCLFQVREDELIAHFPVERAKQFSTRPVLISTNPKSNVILHEQTENFVREGQWKSGDRFFMMTDALAHWFLDRVEAGEKPWLAELGEDAFVFPSQFPNWISEIRAAKTIRNDDVTLLMIRVDRDHEISTDG